MKDQITIEPNLPSHWGSSPLRELCSFHNGLWKGKKGPFETAHVIRNTNFTSDGRIDLSDVAVLEVEAKQLAKRQLQKNDIIIEKSGGGPKQPVGRVVLFELEDGAYSFSNFTGAIRVEDSQTLDPVYLHRVLYDWYLSGRTEPLQRRSTGIRNLDFNAYKDLEVPLPPLEEQKRIVAVLDQAFAALDRARAHAEANLADAGNLDSIACDGYLGLADETWATEKLGFFCTFEGGFAFKSGDAVKASSVQIVRIGNLYKNILDLDRRPSFYPDSFAQKFGRYKLLRGDIIMSLTGTVGKQDYGFAVEVPETEVTLLLNQRVARIRPLDPSCLDSRFLLQFLMSRSFLEKLYKLSRGTRQANLSTKDMANMEVSIPPIERQHEIVASLASVEKGSSSLISNYRDRILGIAELRQSLLQKAFSGQLTA